MTGIADVLFRLNQVCERGVGHYAHRWVVVGTTRHDLARPFELALAFVGQVREARRAVGDGPLPAHARLSGCRRAQVRYDRRGRPPVGREGLDGQWRPTDVQVLGGPARDPRGR